MIPLPVQDKTQAPALVSAAVFLALIVGVGVVEVTGGNVPGAEIDLEKVALGDGSLAREIDEEFTRRSVVAEDVRGPYNEWLWRVFGKVTPRVVVGRDRWLFEPSNVLGYPRPGADETIRRHVEAIAWVNRWFAERGCQLVVLPVPNKWALYPEKLPRMLEPPRSIWPKMVRELETAGVWTIDAAPALDRSRGPSYVSNNTHWTDEACLRVSRLLADEIRSRLGEALPGEPFEGEVRFEEQDDWRGDLQRMLGFEKGSAVDRSFLASRKRVIVIRAGGRRRYNPRGRHDIVLCGTSFAHTSRMAEMLAVSLGRHVEDRAVPGKGPTVGLLGVMDEMRAGKRRPPHIVAWEFPEKHVFVRKATFLRPLEALARQAETAGSFVARSAQALTWSNREARNLEIEVRPDGGLAGKATSGDPQLIFVLNEALPADGSWALAYRVRSARQTTTKVMIDWGGGFSRNPSQVVPVFRAGATQEIVIPVEGPPGATTTRFRLDPVDCRTTFELSDLEIRYR